MGEGNRKVGIIGCGIVGRSWAVSFARAGFEVRVFDRDRATAISAEAALRLSLEQLERIDMLDGQRVEEVFGRISVGEDLKHTVEGSDYIQENTPEAVPVKIEVFAELDKHAPPDAIIASSTSALLPSQFAIDLTHPERCLVAHPLNPPHLIPAVELVPSPVTSKDAIQKAMSILRAAGQKPLLVQREIEGFLMNRLQGALLDEAFAMVAEGYATPEDVDIAVKDGLARRWSFMGPFETIDLNAPNGMSDFISRYGEAYASIGKQRPSRHDWGGDVAARIVAARRRELPAEAIPQRQEWRDRRLASLAAYMKKTSDELGE